MPLPRDNGSLREAILAHWHITQRAMWHATKNVTQSEMKVQRHWETSKESFLAGSEQAEHANGRAEDSYWRWFEAWEAQAREWDRKNVGF